MAEMLFLTSGGPGFDEIKAVAACEATAGVGVWMLTFSLGCSRG